MLMATLHKTWNTFSTPNIFQTLNKYRVMLIWQFAFHEVAHLMEIKLLLVHYIIHMFCKGWFKTKKLTNS